MGDDEMVLVPRQLLEELVQRLNGSAEKVIPVAGNGDWSQSMVVRLRAEAQRYPGAKAAAALAASRPGEPVSLEEVMSYSGLSKQQVASDLGGLSKASRRLFGKVAWPFMAAQTGSGMHYIMGPGIAAWWRQSHYDVRFVGEVSAYNRDVLLPVPRFRLYRDGEHLCTIDALLSNMAFMGLQDQVGRDRQMMRHALVRYVAMGIEEAVIQQALPSRHTELVQRLAVMDGDVPDDIQFGISEAGFRLFLAPGRATLPVEPSDEVIHSFDADSSPTATE